MVRGSSKPCPGCGKVVSGRKPDEVCFLCREKLAKYDKLAAALGKTENDVRVVYDDWCHLNGKVLWTYDEHNGEFEGWLHRLVQAFSRPDTTKVTLDDIREGRTPTVVPVLGQSSGSGKPRHALLPKPLVELIIEIRQLIPAIVKSRYEAGKRDGQNLLLQLASGELSQRDFDKAIGIKS